MNSHLYVLVPGDLIGGFMFTGPYATLDDAELAAGDSSMTTVARLWTPAEAPDYVAD